MNISTIAIGVIVGLRRALRDRAPRRAAVFLEQLRPGLGLHGGARLEHVHHDEAERHGDRHVQEEQREGADRERTELPEALELRDAHGERGEHERDHDEEQHPQEDLAERIEHVGRELCALPAGGPGTHRRARASRRRRPRR